MNDHYCTFRQLVFVQKNAFKFNNNDPKNGAEWKSQQTVKAIDGSASRTKIVEQWTANCPRQKPTNFLQELLFDVRK